MANKVASVFIKVSADGADFKNDLKKLTAETRKFGSAVNKQSNRIKYAFNKIRRAAQVVASAYIFTAGVKSLGRLALGMERAEEGATLMQARMRQFGRSGDAFARTYDLAKKVGISMDDAADGMTRLLIASKSFGASQGEIEQMYENIVLLGRAGGTSGEEMKGAMRQLSQGMASGRLAGEELRSVLENLPLVAYEITKELGITIGEIRDFGSEGKITGEVVTAALQNIPEAIKTLPEVFSMHTARMKTEWDLFLAALGKKIQIDVVMNVVTGQLAIERERMGDFSTSSDERLEQLISEKQDLLRRYFGATYAQMREATGGPGGVAALKKELELAREQLVLLNEEQTKRVDAAAKLLEAEIAKAAAKVITQADILNSIVDKLLKEIPLQDPSDKLAAAWGRINKELDKTTEAVEKKLGGSFKVFTDKVREAQAAIGRGINLEQWQEYRRMLKDDLIPALEDVEDKTNEMSEYAKRAAQNIQDAFADFLFDPFDEGLKGMVEGFITAIRRMLANQLAFQAITGIKSWWANAGAAAVGGSGSYAGAQAGGGTIRSGQFALVGERGPELFAPGMSGRVIPNGAMGAVNNYYFEAGADIATIEARIIPMLERTENNSVQRVLQMRGEGRL